jgi:hypothetical protein
MAGMEGRRPPEAEELEMTTLVCENGHQFDAPVPTRLKGGLAPGEDELPDGHDLACQTCGSTSLRLAGD